MKATIHTAPLFPDGTTIGVYRATGYATFPSSGPPGSAVDEAESSAGSVTFEGLGEAAPYFAAAKVAGEWVSKRFLTSSIAKGFKGYCQHGADASASRPPDFPSVEWHGSVEPENAVDGDTWIEE